VVVEQVPTRQRLLDRTIEVIEAEGVPGVRVQPIAAAGVAVPSVYHFFGSKEGLIEAAQAERYGRVLAESSSRFAIGVQDSADAAEFRQRCRTALLGFCDDEGAARRLSRINALGSGYAHPELLAALNETQARASEGFAGVIAAAQERGWIRPELDPAAVAAWLMGSILGRVLIEIGPNQVDPDRWNAVFLEAAFGLLFGDTSDLTA
jgi:AcrR family transcriptional regulator